MTAPTPSRRPAPPAPPHHPLSPFRLGKDGIYRTGEAQAAVVGVDISQIEEDRCVEDAAILVEGGHGHVISDVRGNGRHQLAEAVWLDAPNSKVERVAVDNLRRFGVISRQGGYFRDIQTGHTRDRVDSQGTAEQGVHLEGSVDAARIFDRGSRIGLLTINCTGKITDVNTALNSTAGIYIETGTHNLIMDRILVAKSRVGVQFEPPHDGFRIGKVTLRNTSIQSGWDDLSFQHYGFGLWCNPGNGPLHLENVTVKGLHGVAIPRGTILDNVNLDGCTGEKLRWLD